MLHNISEIRYFVTYQITFLMTCPAHKNQNRCQNNLGFFCRKDNFFSKKQLLAKIEDSGFVKTCDELVLVCCHESVISLEEVSKTKCSKWHEETIVKIEETDIVRNELYIKVSILLILFRHA